MQGGRCWRGANRREGDEVVYLVNKVARRGKGRLACVSLLYHVKPNFLPSLGLMDDMELLVNMVAWAILLITIMIKFSYEELEHNVKKYWMMAETGNPQFAIACSEVASAFGSFLILISYCWYFCKLLIRLKKEVNVSNSNVRSKMKGYAIYVLQIEDEAKLSEEYIQEMHLKSINQLLSKV
ncbi:hypothetical protein Tco_0431266 [Tanacetum coccineum]